FETLIESEGVLFFRVDPDGHHQSVEETCALLDHPEMADCDGIKAPGVNACTLCLHGCVLNRPRKCSVLSGGAFKTLVFQFQSDSFDFLPQFLNIDLDFSAAQESQANVL